jgi:UDP-N-acetylmuramyl pentapeptide phosphotransferase/UDP-N-acetylglucosamine-1-phosphate transferase
MVAVVGVFSFAVAWVALRLLLAHFGRVALDRPNTRSLHENPVPRIGGIAIMLAVLAVLPLGTPALWFAFGLAVALAALSFVDDLRGVSAITRLVCHAAAAAVFMAYALSPLGWAAQTALALGLVWMTNLFNFMDGSDGLAGGMALIGFSAYALAAAAADHTAIVAFSAALAGAAGAFLFFNFHPARVFLGDVGSVPLGFLAAALGLLGWRDDVWPLWFPVVVFAFFICDATLTLLKRLARGERVWQPHRQHYYQRLVQLGAGHRGTAFIGYAVMLVCAVAALCVRTEPARIQLGVLVLVAAFMATLAVWVDLQWARRQRSERANNV